MILFDQAGAGAATAKMLAPPPPLRPFVEHLWVQQGIVASQAEVWRIPPDANPYLILTVSTSASGATCVRCRLVGPASDFFDMPVCGRTYTCGIRLRPGVLPLLMRLPASELTDGFLPVEDAFGPRGRLLIDELNDPSRRTLAPQRMATFLAHELSKCDPFRSLPARQVRSVHEFATTTGWSARTLQYRAQEQIGLAPKLWLRIERLHRAIACSMQRIESWSSIAARSGFADQAHMVREFVDLLGETPTAWSRRGPFLPPDGALGAI